MNVLSRSVAFLVNYLVTSTIVGRHAFGTKCVFLFSPRLFETFLDSTETYRVV